MGILRAAITLSGRHVSIKLSCTVQGFFYNRFDPPTSQVGSEGRIRGSIKTSNYGITLLEPHSLRMHMSCLFLIIPTGPLLLEQRRKAGNLKGLATEVLMSW